MFRSPLRTCRCIVRPSYATEDGPGAPGAVEINGVAYVLLCHGKTTRDGYRLANRDNDAVYDVDTSTGQPVCDCPDYLTRRGRVDSKHCKHGLALIQLRKERVL